MFVNPDNSRMATGLGSFVVERSTRGRPRWSRWMAMVLLGAGAQVAHSYDIPTGLPPSPLFGAEPFTQQMLLFEEFGVQSVPRSDCRNCVPLPQVADCASSPTGTTLDRFLRQSLSPLPTEAANTSLRNPWHERIEQCLGRTLQTSAQEGRPPGVWFSHQRWNDFNPRD